MSDSYILLKDYLTPGGLCFPKGSGLTLDKRDVRYFEVEGSRFHILRHVVENNPDWFTKVIPPEKEWSDDDMKNCWDYAQYCFKQEYVYKWRHTSFDDYIKSKNSPPNV